MKDFDLTKIFGAMKANDVNELIITEGSKCYEIRRGGFKNSMPQQSVPVQQIQPAQIQTVATQNTPTVSSQQTPVNTSKDSGSNSNYYEVKSPLVGTFYSSPKPDSPSFVEVGQKVTKGQTLCIIEAMKNFNEIECDVNGIVKEVCVSNASLVEFNQVIFRIEQS